MDVLSNPEAVASRGRAMYERLRHQHPELDRAGTYVAIDVETGNFFTGATDIEADAKAKDQAPGGVFHLVAAGGYASMLQIGSAVDDDEILPG